MPTHHIDSTQAAADMPASRKCRAYRHRENLGSSGNVDKASLRKNPRNQSVKANRHLVLQSICQDLERGQRKHVLQKASTSHILPLMIPSDATYTQMSHFSHLNGYSSNVKNRPGNIHFG